MAGTTNDYSHRNLNGNNLVNVGNINCGMSAINSSQTIDPSVTKYVIATAAALTTLTVTLNATTARPGMEVWIKRSPSSAGNLAVATSSGNIENPSGGLLAGILNFVLSTSYRQVGWMFDGTNWYVISAS